MMKRRILLSVMALWFAAAPLLAQQPTAASPEVAASARKARQALEQAVQALGGRAYLEVRDLHQEGRAGGFYRGAPSGAGGRYHRFWKAHYKERLEFLKQRDWIVIINGDQGYDITFRGTRKADADDLAEHIRRRNHSLDTVLRHWLSRPDVILSYEGLAMSDRKQVEKVTLFRPGFDAVTVFIDTATHLPLRTSYSFRDPKTREIVEEGETFDNYKLVQGINTPHNIVLTRDGEMLRQYFVQSIEYNTGVPDSKFEATITYELKLR